jgi:hypothetical protein
MTYEESSKIVLRDIKEDKKWKDTFPWLETLSVCKHDSNPKFNLYVNGDSNQTPSGIFWRELD